MSNLDEETIAKLLALKDKMLGHDKSVKEEKASEEHRVYITQNTTVKINSLKATKKRNKIKKNNFLSNINKKQIIVKKNKQANLTYTFLTENFTQDKVTPTISTNYNEISKYITDFNEEFYKYNDFKNKKRHLIKTPNETENVFENLNNKIFKKTNKRNDDIFLCIGLDIGSSTTKVVIKEAYSENDIFYLVTFGSRGIYGQEYLLPTHISIDNNNYFIPQYGREPTFSNLKVNYMNGINEYEKLLIYYIAFTIKYTIAWFTDKHGKDDIIKNKNIIWSVNLGIPSAQFNTEKKNKKYLHILENACKLIENENIFFENINIVPEIVASIQSFIRRNEITHTGLYCVSDIGAGTLDVCTFRVLENDYGVIYSFFKSLVKQIGVYTLEKCCKNSFNQLNSVQNYKNDVLSSYKTVLYQTFRKRDPKAKEWKEKLPLVISGGGSSLSFYKNIINNDLTKWIKNTCIDIENNNDCQGFRNIDIKYNKNNIITDIESIDCTRLNVALGLSYNIETFDDIKKYYKECEVEDIKVYQIVEIDNRYIDKSQT